MSGPYIYRVPFVSTAHVAQGTMEMLTSSIEGGDRPGAVYEEGIWLRVNEVDLENDPPELRTLLDWARRQKFEHIRLDRDGDTIEGEGLQTFDW